MPLVRCGRARTPASPSMVLLVPLSHKKPLWRYGVQGLDKHRADEAAPDHKNDRPEVSLAAFKNGYPPCANVGATAWHMHLSCLGVAMSALLRMARLILHAHRPDTEPWVEWRTCS